MSNQERNITDNLCKIAHFHCMKQFQNVVSAALVTNFWDFFIFLVQFLWNCINFPWRDEKHQSHLNFGIRKKKKNGSKKLNPYDDKHVVPILGQKFCLPVDAQSHQNKSASVSNHSLQKPN